ncbi:hypothetical protein GUITHDRAFT_119450 [Guillardia theta CCMP2712]|uniref:Uncharacterized protein n=1 Tax=Guillardia theta (strain CCMP2712) TaxID=905079 RepID=L1IEN8_GUITC|nr:hypothetical protein GUITHDRAFT_119450 [Guillardia theta CCMP2712]EKX34364.1 hypothetical protein GUITHDRAFT_119450 [Guillardia theta CCMP2712]|eukprot:XP_005821344.1 hypothetical protein GUITHDRAFT_119450 [Guillardia theta CCMP2712]
MMKEQSLPVCSVLAIVGFRYRKADYMYEKDWEELFSNDHDAVLKLAYTVSQPRKFTNIFHRFSRDGKQKEYVQHKIALFSDEIWDALTSFLDFDLLGLCQELSRKLSSRHQASRAPRGG